ncbi:MAG: cobalt ECF transporter T component CbiQ [Nitrospirae bacterium]|nr:cobalt ECF transporter T component CbiQ [Nitrospirota bacterium]
MTTQSDAAIGSSFVDKGLNYIAAIIKAGYDQWELASQKGLLQKFDPRVKILFLLFFIGLISFKQTIFAESALGAFIFVLAALSKLNIASFYKRVFFLGFFFGFLVALPSSLNIITRGEVIFHVFEFPKAYDFWGYHLPMQVGMTRQGIAGVMMLTLRVSNSVALSLLVISTTPFHDLVKALKVLRVPDVFLLILTLTYKYIFIFAKTVESLYLAKKGRLARRTSGADGRKWVAGRMAFIFRKTQMRCEDVFSAMQARGFSDDVRFYGCRILESRDLVFVSVIGLAGLVVIFL